jgi:excinuclease ABC subunit A
MDCIIVKGAGEHNLKNIDVTVPKDKLVVLTGVSGSGKSSFAFDTLYAEGQRRYIESLSAYARQFLGQLEKPLFESIEGLSPAISIEQKTVSHNPRSTVGTVTEITDYLRVLYARVGSPHCPDCGRPVTTQSVQKMVDTIMALPEGSRLLVTAPLVKNRKGSHGELVSDIRKKGYVRILLDGEIHQLESLPTIDKKRKHDLAVVVDRLVIGKGIESRLADSVETAVREGKGILSIIDTESGSEILMSEHNACVYCGISMPELSPQLFSFNNPVGMCDDCSGLGYQMKLDPLLIVPRSALSINAGAIAPVGVPKGWMGRKLKAVADVFDINLGAPWKRLSEEQQDAILHGSGDRRILFRWEGEKSKGQWEDTWEGIIPMLERRYLTTSSTDSRISYERFFRKVACESCGGARLRREARSVLVGELGIHQISTMTVGEAVSFFRNLELDGFSRQVASELLKEIIGRLSFLTDVGLHYLTLDRPAPTLSGGEAQRIRLASQIGSGLTGVLYVLDEPTIGLHQRDNSKLISTLENLRDIGNTVLIVEHDRETIMRADHVIDFGPGAGSRGGEVIATGTPEEISKLKTSLTGRYLSGNKSISRMRTPRVLSQGKIRLKGASLHNLKGVDLTIPLGRFVCVTGVSGSGKSSLVTQTLYPALSTHLGGSCGTRPGPYRRLDGTEHLDKVISISQDPIGRTPRSNPATYTKVFDHIRRLFAELPHARVRGYKPGRFSFNVKGGRCEDCRGAGVKRIEMHFLPDVFVECQTCKGRRFNSETQKVRFRDHSIADVLDLTVYKALKLFERVPHIYRILKVLQDVGLGYIQLGQQAPTLSGGEAQRVKLAKELSRPGSAHTLYILDEPTTGLHPHDVRKLLQVLDSLVRAGNTVIVIEHNMDVIKNADWIIDLGPDGGDAGGEIIAEGLPEKIAESPDSYTGMYLKQLETFTT